MSTSWIVGQRFERSSGVGHGKRILAIGLENALAGPRSARYLHRLDGAGRLSAPELHRHHRRDFGFRSRDWGDGELFWFHHQ
jgi:hypothetical protein